MKVDQLKPATLAKCLGTSDSTVRSWLRKGLQAATPAELLRWIAVNASARASIRPDAEQCLFAELEAAVRTGGGSSTGESAIFRYFDNDLPEVDRAFGKFGEWIRSLSSKEAMAWRKWNAQRIKVTNEGYILAKLLSTPNDSLQRTCHDLDDQKEIQRVRKKYRLPE